MQYIFQVGAESQTRFPSGSGLTAAACQSKLALVVSMHIRNTGELLSRLLPRLRRARTPGRRTEFILKRRHSTCPPVWLTGPKPFPAATAPSSNTSTAWRPPSTCPSHRYRGSPQFTSTALVAPSADATTIVVFSPRFRSFPPQLHTSGKPKAQSPARGPSTGSARPPRTSRRRPRAILRQRPGRTDSARPPRPAARPFYPLPSSRPASSPAPPSPPFAEPASSR